MRHASFFSGIGGSDLAASRLGWDNVLQCEWDSFCQKVLKYYWPNAAFYEDITKSDFSIWRGRVDIVTGGFPCQPFSVAGERKGAMDNRYLWPDMLRAITQIRPTWAVLENVTGLLTMADPSSDETFCVVERRKITRTEKMDDYEAVYLRQATMLIESICGDLEKEGYEVQPLVIPAAGTGAPHRRDRVFIVAYADGFWGRTQGHGEARGATAAAKGQRGQRQRHRCDIERTTPQGAATHTQSITSDGRQPETLGGSPQSVGGRDWQYNEQGNVTHADHAGSQGSKQHAACSILLARTRRTGTATKINFPII